MARKRKPLYSVGDELWLNICLNPLAPDRNRRDGDVLFRVSGVPTWDNTDGSENYALSRVEPQNLRPGSLPEDEFYDFIFVEGDGQPA